MNLKPLIRLSFVPSSTDFALLLLRVWLGLSMFLIHGLGKVQNFQQTVSGMAKMGLPAPLGYAAVLTESLFALLLVVGFATRWAALSLVVAMSIAFFHVHKMVLEQGNPASGEMAFIYLGGYLAILIAGPGRFSVDAKLR